MRAKSLLGVGRPGQPGKKCAELSSRCIWDMFFLFNLYYLFHFSLQDGSTGRRKAGGKVGVLQDPP